MPLTWLIAEDASDIKVWSIHFRNSTVRILVLNVWRKRMNFLSTLVTFKSLHEVRRLCHWGPVIALSVIAICSTMALLDSIIWYWPLDTTGGSINFIMLLNWTVLILYNYFNAMFVGPGYIPLGWKPVRITHDYTFHWSLFEYSEATDTQKALVYKWFVYFWTGEPTWYSVPAVLQSVPRVQGPKIAPLSQV